MYLAELFSFSYVNKKSCLVKALEMLMFPLNLLTFGREILECSWFSLTDTVSISHISPGNLANSYLMLKNVKEKVNSLVLSAKLLSPA